MTDATEADLYIVSKLTRKPIGRPIICLLYTSMPDGAPISKVEATKAYGAQVCLVKGAYDDAYDYEMCIRDSSCTSFGTLAG